MPIHGILAALYPRVYALPANLNDSELPLERPPMQELPLRGLGQRAPGTRNFIIILPEFMESHQSFIGISPDVRIGAS